MRFSFASLGSLLLHVAASASSDESCAGKAHDSVLLQTRVEHMQEELDVLNEGQVSRSSRIASSGCPLVDYLEGIPKPLNPLLKLPEKIFGTGSLIDYLNKKLGNAQSKKAMENRSAQIKTAMENTLPVILGILPANSTKDKLHDLGDSRGIDACANLEVVHATDVVAFGFVKSDASSFCAAFNPCTHTYALSQVDILPKMPFSKTSPSSPEIEASIDVMAISLSKELNKTSANNLWEGGGHAPAPIGVEGHFFIQGTITISMELRDDMSLEVEVVCKMILNMDPGNDGVFSPLAKGSAKQTDWAFMLSGEAKPIIHLPDDNSLDLGGLITTSADMYVEVSGADSKFQFGAHIAKSLKVLCDASPALKLLCEIFEEKTGLQGSLLMYANAGGFGLRAEVAASFGLKSDFLEDLMHFPKGSVTAGLQLTYVAKKPNICVDWKGKQVCFGKCKRNSDCPDNKFCDHIFKVCSKKRKNGGKCGQDAACKSKHCVLGFCRECEGQGDCPDANQYCTDKTSLHGPNKCQNKHGDGWKVCTRSHQCKNYCKNGFCGECSEDKHCSSGQYCSDRGSCKSPHSDGWGVCTRDVQCKHKCLDAMGLAGVCGECKENHHCGSGRYCNKLGECKGKHGNGWFGCYKGSQCKSGHCRWTKCSGKKHGRFFR